MEVSDLINAITKEANAQGVPPEFALQLFGAENFKGGKIPAKGDVPTDRVSPKNASGIMQVIPDTWKGLIKNGVLPTDADPKDPLTNIKAGVAVAKERLTARGGNQIAAAADYNGGISQGDLVMAGKSPSFPETQRYIANTSGGATVGAADSSTPQPRTSSGYRVSSSGIDTGVANDNLNAAIGKNQEVLDLMSAAIDGRSEQFKQIATQAKIAGDAAGDRAEAEGAIEIAKNQKGRSILNLLGGELTPDQVMLQSKIAVEQERKKQDALRAQIDPRDAVTIYDDPLQWLVNKFELPTLKKQYNQSLIVEDTMLQRQAATQQRIAAQQQIDQPNLEEQIKRRVNAERAGAAADAAIKAAQAMATSEQDTIHLLTQTAAINQWDYSSWIQLASKTAERYQWNEQVSQQSARDKQLTEEVLNPLNMKRKSVGLPLITIGMWNQLDAKTRSEQMKESLTPQLGKNPEATVGYLMDTGAMATLSTANPPLARFTQQQLNSPEVKKAKELLSQTMPAAQFSKLTDDEITQKAYAKLSADQIKEYLEPEKKGVLFNMTNAPDSHFAKFQLRNAVLDDSLKNNPLIPTLNEIIQTKKGQPITDKDLVSSVLAKAISDEKQIPLLAQNLANIYQVSSQNQWGKAAAQFGFPKPKGYSLDVFDQVQPPGPFRDKKAVDMFSPAQIEAALIRAVAREKDSQAEMNQRLIWNNVDLTGVNP